jgi:hypothetical protein
LTVASPDLTATRFLLPPDAKLLPVSELSPRLRARIGPVDAGQSVITRPGLRVTTRLVPAPLADLIDEFREPSLVTDAVVRFAQARDQEASAILDMAFDALATLIEARILVPDGSLDGDAPVPSLSAGQGFAGFEIEELIRSLDDSEVYRARRSDGSLAALKIARDARPEVAAMFANEAWALERLGGIDSPRLLEHATERDQGYIAMEWCDGVSIAIAAQQLRASRDRRRLHDLVRRMLDAYGRLHDRGVLHGDIHPGNCLVRDDGRIVLLDFGNARPVDRAADEIDPARAGIPQFYDPQIAGELLAGRLPRAATPASEQFSIAVLADLLLTGLHPIASVAVQDELMRRIAERPPLPFAARGVAAWPDVEAVVRRGLALHPGERFSDVQEFARAFAAADQPSDERPRPPRLAQRAFDAAVGAVRSLAPSPESPPDLAWFGLRAAVALDDAELLAAADIVIRRAGPGWAAQAVAAHVARARSDDRLMSAAISGFLVAADPLPNGPEAAAAVLAAVSILEGATPGSEDGARLAVWSQARLDRLMPAIPSTDGDPPVPEPLSVIGMLSLCKSGAIAIPADLAGRLEALRETRSGNVWLWAVAHDVYADDRFRALALSSTLPSKPIRRAFALLRLHQLTGDPSWVAQAVRVAATAPPARLPNLDRALIVAELKAPELAILPPFLVPAGADRRRRTGGRQKAVTTGLKPPVNRIPVA